MAYWDINFTAFWNNNVPPRRRQPKRLARGAVYMRPLQWLRDTFFRTYVNTILLSDIWDGGTQYYPGDEVVFRNDKACYKVIDGMTPPIGTDPTNTQYWIKIASNWVGFNMRQHTTSERRKLEFYLNTYFITNYANPPFNSDIFINTTGTVNNTFICGSNEALSSTAVYANGEAVTFVKAQNPSYGIIDFQVGIPTAVYNLLAGDDATRNKIIRQQIDPRISAGISYDIQPY